MGNGIILNIINKYGKVEGMRLNKYTKEPAAGLLNGTRTFKVNLKNNIPSSVTVGGHSLTFLYAGQRKTYYKCGHEGHLAIDCHTEELGKVNIFNEEDFPAIQLSGKIHSSRAGVKEGVESVTVSQVPATTRHGVEREEVPVQTISQDAVDPEGTTHPDCSENAAQETSTTCEAEIHTERNNVDQTKGKISCENAEYDKADDAEATNMTGTECEVARCENMDRMEEIVEATCNMSPSINRYDANKKEQNKLVKNEMEINSSDDENQYGQRSENDLPPDPMFVG
ncbi:hypothetical protein Hamer_G002409 [Homarus americanus]|uniref:CCHC-type domain-containing protein n=1 Tax=Homarus americanus TaxID=6706 RepID=A0A8J5MXT2_HOMAM|nr:hypothetical protein Hamer_G002409 [Homarus americanus]